MPKILSRNDCVEAELRLSPMAGVFVLVAAVSTLAVVLAIPLAAGLRGGLVLLIGLSTLRAFRRECRRADDAVRSIRVHSTGEIEVTAAGSGICGEVRSGSFVAPFLTVIRWRPERTRIDKTIVILPDMLPPDAFRRLRVVLRWGAIPTSAGKDARTAGSPSAPRAGP